MSFQGETGVMVCLDPPIMRCDGNNTYVAVGETATKIGTVESWRPAPLALVERVRNYLKKKKEENSRPTGS